MKVLVYGTLKKDCGNHHRLNGATFVKEAFVKGYKLLDCGFPVARENETTFVKGEIWDIGDVEEPKGKAILQGLDALEGYREKTPENSMYVRRPVITVCGEQVEMYIGNRDSFRSLQDCPSQDGVFDWSYIRRYA